MDRKEAYKFMPLVHDIIGHKLMGEYEAINKQKGGYDLYKEWGLHV
jgi:hypothetical protein